MGHPRWFVCNWTSGSGRNSKLRGLRGTGADGQGATTATSWRPFCSQLDQHRYDAHEHALRGLVPSIIEQLESETDIQERRRLRCRAPGRQVSSCITSHRSRALLGCLSLENRAGSGPRRARAMREPGGGTRHKPWPTTPPQLADGDLRTVGHVPVYAESAAFRDIRYARSWSYWPGSPNCPKSS
jgi:hypothetical protein